MSDIVRRTLHVGRTYAIASHAASHLTMKNEMPESMSMVPRLAALRAAGAAQIGSAKNETF